MPHRTAEELRRHLDQSQIFVPASDSEVNNLAIIHALRTAADGLKRLADQQDRQDLKMDTITEKVSETNTRLTVLEKSTLIEIVKDHETRINMLENESERRKGAIGLWDFVLKSWPALIGFVTLIATLIVLGEI